jgi:acylphosphatase
MRRRLVVHGSVQGVGYRVSCAHHARAVGVTGWVRNLSDGGVEVVIEGRPDAVTNLEAWCRRGPKMARVTSVEASDESPIEEPKFEII